MNLAFLSLMDPHDKRSWSGSLYCMAKALERRFDHVTYLGPVPEGSAERGLRIFCRITKLLLRKKYDYNHSIFLSRRYAAFFRNKLGHGLYDVIFAPVASSAIAFLETDIPIVYLSDATLPLLINYYPDYTDILGASLANALLIEKMAISRSRHLLYPSGWAARSARDEFGKPADAVHVIPFGANLDDPPERHSVLPKMKTDVCTLLFLAKSWERKGGPIACETHRNLLEKGVPSRLVICGTVPPEHFRRDGVNVIPYLDKNRPGDMQKIRELLLHSDFLVLPTRADCYGIVFCEASAYGLPSISTDTGGVSGAVKEGVNGFLLPLSATGREYAEKIASVFEDTEKYHALRESSRSLYEKTLNWDSWADAAAAVMRTL